MDLEPGEHDTAASSAVILTDRPCTDCGYNLRGLAEGGVCPECGTRIVASGPRFDRISDNLTDAPKGYLRLVASGVWMLVSAILLVPALIIADAFATLPVPTPTVARIVLAAAAVLWATGAVLVTTPRPAGAGLARDILLDSDKLRWAVRGLQAAVLIAAGIELARLAVSHIALEIGGAAASLLALGGFLTLSVYLSSLADWAGEEGIGSRLRSATWAVVVCGGGSFILLLSGSLGLPILGVVGYGLALLLGLIASIAQLVVLFSIIQLGSTTLWALRNAKASVHVQRRRAERLAREADEQAARAGRAHDAMPPAANTAAAFDEHNPDDPLPLSEPDPDAARSRTEAPGDTPSIRHMPPGIAAGRRNPPRDRF